MTPSVKNLGVEAGMTYSCTYAEVNSLLYMKRKAPYCLPF